MPPTTTCDTASAFKKKPVVFETSAWSGRVDVAQTTRPGGLLTAALMQLAAERDFSMSELATALGVSYWSLSSLRIGFRAVESLDEDVIEGCSALLDLPPLTVQALAGLLSPDDVLASADLTAEDLLHARQLASTAPDDLRLLPPPNRARPLHGLTIDQLIELHREHAAHPVVVELLRVELGSRPLSKTEQLRAAMAREPIETPAAEAVQRESAAPATGVLCCPRCQKRLRIPHLPEPGEIRCPSCATEYAVHWQGYVCLVQVLEELTGSGEEDGNDHAGSADGPPFEQQDAWSILGLAPHSPWDQVERARRSLLQQYHPDRLGHVSPLVRQLAEAAFKRVNTAFETVRAERR